MARASERQAERERRHGDNLEGRVQNGDDRHELLWATEEGDGLGVDPAAASKFGRALRYDGKPIRQRLRPPLLRPALAASLQEAKTADGNYAGDGHVDLLLQGRRA